jgi:hypothetical protein
MCEIHSNPPWTINICLKNKGQVGKTGPFQRWVPVGGGG